MKNSPKKGVAAVCAYLFALWGAAILFAFLATLLILGSELPVFDKAMDLMITAAQLAIPAPAVII